MRTTVNIDDDLLAQAKALATTGRKSLGDVIDDALRTAFSQRRSREFQPRVSLETDGRSGLKPGVDLEDKEAIAELLEENRLPSASG